MKIKIIEKPFEIEVKRCYLPIILEVHCNKCKCRIVQDISDSYLSYPNLYEREEIHFWCPTDGCENEFTKIVEIGLTVRECGE